MVVTSPHWPKTIPSLNGLRAVSVLLVVSAHAGLSDLIPGGLGVTIFFFLSGYLITTLMLAENEQTGAISIRNFYARRILRLAPPLLITLAIAYSLTYLGFLQGRITLAALVSQLLYFANYYILFFDPNAQSMPGGTGILWSLAVEEHFYIFFPTSHDRVHAWRLAIADDRSFANYSVLGGPHLAYSPCTVTRLL